MTLRKTIESICPGRVIDPAHPEYDATRLLFNGAHDKRPALIALPADRPELQRLIVAAREAGVRTAVRGGGHNVAGLGSVDGGLVIDLRRMRAVRVDPAAKVAYAGGGATWADFDTATVAHGLATTGGTFDTTGVGGLTLGGGIGHLMGRYGLTCDNVLSYSLVTADGEHLTVDPASDPELDWALRGAGHNFGVVDEFTFRLHDVPQVYGGYVAYRASALGEAVRFFRDLMTDAPDELVCTLLLERYGDDQVPAAVLSVCYNGDDAEYRASLDKQLRALDVLDWQVFDRSYLSMQLCLGRLDFGLRHYWSARMVEEFPDELADALVERFAASRYIDPFNATIIIEPIHGAVRRVAEDATAVPFRGSRFNITGMAIWGPPDADAEETAWAKSVAAAAERYGRPGDGYINYVSDIGDAQPAGDEQSRRAVDTFGERRHARLLAVKRRLDPDNFFRTNYNLDPRTA